MEGTRIADEITVEHIKNYAVEGAKYKKTTRKFVKMPQDFHKSLIHYPKSLGIRIIYRKTE